MDKTVTIVREWVRAGSPPYWSDCAGLSPELQSWHLQCGNLSIDFGWSSVEPQGTAGGGVTVGGTDW